MVANDEPDIDVKKALTSDPIVCVEKTLLDENGPGARRAVPIKAPAEMTPAQWEEHPLTHLPVLSRMPMLCNGKKTEPATLKLAWRRSFNTHARCRRRLHPRL